MLGKKKPLDGLFAQLQDIKDDNGNLLNTVLFSEKGDCSVIIEIENPVQQYCTDAEQYMMFTDVLNNCAEQYRPDIGRGLCASETGYLLQAVLSP